MKSKIEVYSFFGSSEIRIAEVCGGYDKSSDLAI
jgi:hypothetical protein